ncbi:MAG: hypothetical protein ACYCW6_13000, partial [Candidatus Xenobia bacterium]
MVKRIVVSVVLAGLLLTLGAWLYCAVIFKKPLDATEQAILDQTRQRLQAAAPDSAYQDLTPFLSLTTPEGKARLALAKYCLGVAQTRAALEGDPAASRAAVKAFDPVIPRLAAILARPAIVPGIDWKLGLAQHNQQWIALRSLGQALTVAAVRRELDGDVAGSMRDLLLTVELGSKLGKNQNLIGEMVSIAVQNIGMTTLLDIQSRRVLPPKLARQVLQRLQRLPVDEHDLVASTDVEFLLISRTFDMIVDGHIGTSAAMQSLGGLSDAPS